MKCDESSILKTENIDKTEILEKFSRFCFAVSVQNHDDIVESDYIIWKYNR